MKKVKTINKRLLKKIENDIEELEEIAETFATSGKPDSLAEYQYANDMAKWFWRVYPKYTKKLLYKKLPEELQKRLDKLEENEVGAFD